MTHEKVEQWWKRRDHRRIHGSRGARFLSLKTHAVVIFGLLGLVLYVMRESDDVAYRIAPPPVPAPPPMPRSLGYTITSEMPYMKQLETEEAMPGHIPQKHSLNYSGIRTMGKMT